MFSSVKSDWVFLSSYCEESRWELPASDDSPADHPRESNEETLSAEENTV